MTQTVWEVDSELVHNFITALEEDLVENRGRVPHHDQRYDEGWVALMTQNYYPALKRFRGKGSAAQAIVEALKTQGKCEIREVLPAFRLEDNLTEVFGPLDPNISWLVRNGRFGDLMIDRTALGNGGGQPDRYKVQFYIKRQNGITL